MFLRNVGIRLLLHVPEDTGLIFSRRTLLHAVGWSLTGFIVRRHKTET
jgi:hypothetical protein